MNFSTTEIILLSIQILLIPLARYILRQEKKELETQMSKLIIEHYMSLESLIDHNKDGLDKLNEELKHKAEMSRIKSGILNARIKDIEIYLKKANGFQTRQMNELDDSGFL